MKTYCDNCVNNFNGSHCHCTLYNKEIPFEHNDNMIYVVEERRDKPISIIMDNYKVKLIGDRIFMLKTK